MARSFRHADLVGVVVIVVAVVVAVVVIVVLVVVVVVVVVVGQYQLLRTLLAPFLFLSHALQHKHNDNAACLTPESMVCLEFRVTHWLLNNSCLELHTGC